MAVKSCDDRNGPTSLERALDLLAEAESELQSVRGMLTFSARVTKDKKRQAYARLAGVQSSLETLKIALDPW